MSQALPDIAPYFDLHQNATGPGDQRPSAMQVVQEQDLFGKLGHVNILVTGGNSGLGWQTVKALHTTGAQIVIGVAPGVDGAAACREIENSNEVDPQLEAYKPSFKPIDFVQINLGSLADIMTAAATVKEKIGNRLNILVCNAGVMNPGFAATDDGFEPHFGINYLGHFLLFHELADALAKGSETSTSFASRVVIMSSLGHRGANVDIDKLPPSVGNEPEDRVCNFYSESKTELLWMANELDRRYKSRGIHGLSVNPGSIVTPLTAHIGWDTMRSRMGKDIVEFDRLTKDLGQGAATTAWAAISQELEGKGALYLDDIQVARPAIEGTPLFTHGYAPWAYDDEKARRLWNLTMKLLDATGFSVSSQSKANN